MAAGVLIATGDDFDKPALTDAIRDLEAHGVRVVTLAQDTEVLDVPVVASDYRGIGRDAATHLMKQGRSSLLLLGGGSTSSYSRALESGVREAAQPGSVAVSVINGAFQHKSASAAVARLLGRGVRPDGIIAADISMALGAIRALREAGLDMPSDVGLVTCQNDPIAEYLTPSLTAVGGDLDLRGETAVDLLLRRIAGETVERTTILPHSVVPRQSTEAAGLRDAAPVRDTDEHAPELGKLRTRRAGS